MVRDDAVHCSYFIPCIHDSCSFHGSGFKDPSIPVWACKDPSIPVWARKTHHSKVGSLGHPYEMFFIRDWDPRILVKCGLKCTLTGVSLAIPV